jgi:hypothetical protein
VYVTYLTKNIDNNPVDAIGIFKSEPSRLLQFEEKGTHLEMILNKVNLSKLDKGCIIFNHKKEGYKILTVDSNRYDARYWLSYLLMLLKTKILLLKVFEILSKPKDVVFLLKTKKKK